MRVVGVCELNPNLDVLPPLGRLNLGIFLKIAIVSESAGDGAPNIDEGSLDVA
jgi:hypothetical protein